MSELDARVVRVGRRHHDIVSTRQLRTVGFGSASISRRVAEGRLTRLHRGVYLVGPGEPTLRGKWLAAVIAMASDALLSHRDAAMLWGLRDDSRASVDVTVVGSRRSSRPGITVHSARALHPDDRAVRDRIPVTSVERTLLDLAEVVSPHQLQRAYEQAERLRLLDHRKLRELVGRSHGRRGLKALVPLLDYDPTPATEVRSEMESLLLDLVRERGLPPYQRNVVVDGYDVDAYWPEAGLIVELQSYRWHSDREAFERDHAKLARLRVAGYKVLALTHRQLTNERDWVAAAIATLLGLR